MSNFIESEGTIVENAFIQYHDPSIKLPFTLPFLEEKANNELYHFGIIQMNVTQIIKSMLPHQHIVFTIDKSGSMSHSCKDNRTKMEQIIFTLENMIRLFSENTSLPISIHINTFDDECKNCVENTLITSNNAKDICLKIKKIIPESCTNIEKALKYTHKDIKKYMENNRNHEVTHIFLTDGLPSSGNCSPEYLKMLVSDDYPNILIGYGADHDAYLMCELSSNKNSSYLFIDALEKASFVYGEIIHNLLNKIATNATITTNNCQVYNYLTNEWVNEFYIGNLSKGNEKIFQVRSLTPYTSSFTVKLDDMGKNFSIQTYYPKAPLSNCIKYAFRQKTQELLYETKHFIFKQNNDVFLVSPKKNKELQLLKDKVYTFLTILMDYIKENELEDDKFLKMLCDDLYISYQTMGTVNAGVYTCARQTSQGRQTTYNVSIHIPSIPLQNDDDSSDDDIHKSKNHKYHNFSFYTPSDNLDSPYATQDVLDTMRSISVRNVEEEEEESLSSLTPKTP